MFSFSPQILNKAKTFFIKATYPLGSNLTTEILKVTSFSKDFFPVFHIVISPLLSILNITILQFCNFTILPFYHFTIFRKRMIALTFFNLKHNKKVFSFIFTFYLY